MPLLVACGAAWWLRERRAASWWLLAGVLLSTAYLGWSLAAKAIVERAAQRALAAGLQDAPRLSVPMPFNTLLWRVVVMTPDGFLEGERSLVADGDRSSSDGIRATAARWRPWPDFLRCGRLDWFTHGFLKPEQRDGRLVLSDLRMGVEPEAFSVMLSPKATGREAGAKSPSNRIGPLRIASAWLESGDEFGMNQMAAERPSVVDVMGCRVGEWNATLDNHE